MALMRAVLKSSKSVIIVIIGGRPATFGASASDGYNAMFYQASAVVAAWHPGEEGGHALWSILNGTVNPSGHTAHTWPRTVGQVHMYVPHFLEQKTRSPSSQFADYAPATPLVPFGFGLSYSNYTFSNIALSGPQCGGANCTVTADETFNIELDITNHGSMAGKTVVQVYFSQDLCSRVRYSNMLLGFAKFEVEAGTTSKHTLQLKARELEMWSKEENKYIVESGSYTLRIGQCAHHTNPSFEPSVLIADSGVPLLALPLCSDSVSHVCTATTPLSVQIRGGSAHGGEEASREPVRPGTHTISRERGCSALCQAGVLSVLATKGLRRQQLSCRLGGAGGRHALQWRGHTSARADSVWLS